MFDFSLTQEEKVRGVDERDQKGEREGETGHGDSSILCFTPHLSHSIWFVYKQESVTGSFLVSQPNARQEAVRLDSEVFLPISGPHGPE